MEQVQSYLSSIMRGSFKPFEIRIFMSIVRHAQSKFADARYKELAGKAVKSDGISEQFSLQARELLGNGNKNYAGLKAAAETLMKKQVTYFSSESHDWKIASLLSSAEYEGKSGILKITCQKWVLNLIADFSKGFSVYDFGNALKLTHGASVRLYMLLSHQERPMIYSLAFLRQLLGCEKKYLLNADFIKRCIDGPSKELAKHGFNGFTWRPVMDKGDRRKIAGVELTPVKREQRTESQVVALAGVSAFVHPALKQYLMTQCGFSGHELGGNKATLFQFSKLPDWTTLLVTITERARAKRASKGYIINAMKSEISAYNKGGKKVVKK